MYGSLIKYKIQYQEKVIIVSKLVQFLMGSGQTRGTVPIDKSFFHLLQTSQNSEIIKRIRNDKRLLSMKVNKCGDTIAHYACAKNNIELIKVLRELKADFTIQNNKGETPLDHKYNEQISKTTEASVETPLDKSRGGKKRGSPQIKDSMKEKQNNFDEIHKLKKEQSMIKIRKQDDNSKVDLREKLIIQEREKQKNENKIEKKTLICFCHYGWPQ